MRLRSFDQFSKSIGEESKRNSSAHLRKRAAGGRGHVCIGEDMRKSVFVAFFIFAGYELEKDQKENTWSENSRARKKRADEVLLLEFAVK
jgi:hypothetical protein